MKKVIRLTEADLARIVKRVISEQQPSSLSNLNRGFAPTAQKITQGCSKIFSLISQFAKKQTGPYLKLIQAVKANPENINEIIVSYGKTEQQKQKIQEFLNWIDGLDGPELESALISTYKKTEEGKNVQEQAGWGPIDYWLPYITLTLAVIILILKYAINGPAAFGMSGGGGGCLNSF